MIKNINSRTTTNINNKTSSDIINSPPKYNDPLNNWALRGMSYSSDIGVAISEIAPKFGAALWAPTFMYLGADIYDKYKTDKNKFDPSAKRAFKRAVFQALMSLIVMPAVIFTSQKLISPLSKLTKSKLSTNAKDAVIKHTKDILSQTDKENFDDFEKFKKILVSTLKNRLEAQKNEKRSTNIVKRLYNLVTGKYSILKADKDKLVEFAEENAKKLFEIKDAILNKNKKNIPYNVQRKYNKVLPQIVELYGRDYSYSALRSALKEYQKSLIFKNKLLKTAVGFAAMIAFTSPVTSFVDKNIMKKYIYPEIDIMSKELVARSRLKEVFNEMIKRKN